MKNFKDITALLTILVLIVAWLIGNRIKDTNVLSSVSHVLPDADSIQQITDNIYQCSRNNGDQQILLGHVVFGRANGYSGPMLIAVGIDTNDTISNLKIIEHKETTAFLQKIQSHNFLTLFLGRSYNNSFQIGHEIEAVSGATFSSNALATSIQSAGRLYAEKIKKQILPSNDQKSLSFSLKEFVLIILFLISYQIHSKRFYFKKQIYWVVLIMSLVVIGFVYAALLSLTNIIAFLLGFWPDINSNFYWYLIFAIAFLPIIIKKKNIYCHSICPFGAAQECLSLIGGTKWGFTLNVHNKLIWLPRLFAIIFIGTGLLKQNPGIESHEVFSAFFNLTGTDFQFILLAIVVIASLFIKRPWCNYSCPIRGVTDFLLYFRKKADQMINLNKSKLYSNS